MPRREREQIENGIYHLTTRGNRRGPIYLCDEDMELFLRLLRRTVVRFEWELHAFCLMTNHYHLLLTTPQANLSAGMCLLNGHYARLFNDLHGFTGHVFERRFHASLVTSEEHMVVVSAYIALNPVVARCCDRPEDYAWGSYGATVAGSSALPFLSTERLLAQFAGGTRPAREAYRRHVERRQADLALV